MNQQSSRSSIFVVALMTALKLTLLTFPLLLQGRPALAGIYNCQNVFQPNHHLWGESGKDGLYWDGNRWTPVKKSRLLQYVGINRVVGVRDYQAQVDIATQIIAVELGRRGVIVDFDFPTTVSFTPKGEIEPSSVHVVHFIISTEGDHWINRLAKRYATNYSATLVIDPILSTRIIHSLSLSQSNPPIAHLPFHEVIDPRQYLTRTISRELAKIRRMTDRFDSTPQLLKDPYYMPAIRFSTDMGSLINDSTPSFALDEIPGYLMSHRIASQSNDLKKLRDFLSYIKKNEASIAAGLAANLKLDEKSDTRSDRNDRHSSSSASGIPTQFSFKDSSGQNVTVTFPDAILKPTDDLEERRADMRELLEIAGRIVDRTIGLVGLPDPK